MRRNCREIDNKRKKSRRNCVGAETSRSNTIVSSWAPFCHVGGVEKLSQRVQYFRHAWARYLTFDLNCKSIKRVRGRESWDVEIYKMLDNLSSLNWTACPTSTWDVTDTIQQLVRHWVHPRAALKFWRLCWREAFDRVEMIERDLGYSSTTIHFACTLQIPWFSFTLVSSRRLLVFGVTTYDIHRSIEANQTPPTKEQVAALGAQIKESRQSDEPSNRSTWGYVTTDL